MKKTYINPEMEIVKIANQQPMLAGSSFSRSYDFGGGSGDSEGITDADGRGTDYEW